MYLGIDFGTSGCRACIINDAERIVYKTHLPLPAPVLLENGLSQSPDIWWQALLKLFAAIKREHSLSSIQALSINGTSATVLHSSLDGSVLSDALMYNDTSSAQYLDKIKAFAPKNHITLSASSALSKMMKLADDNSILPSLMLNQADWLSNKLCGQFGYSDYNNALKMGYDCQQQSWPSWIGSCINLSLLPKVLAPGDSIGFLETSLAKQFGFKSNVKIKLGTTDSIAAFIATGVQNEHQAVTSLGSTLVLKVLSKEKIEHSQYGLYSHKLGRYWLAGGASNSGGKVLSQYFNSAQLTQLSTEIKANIPSSLNYYPLPAIGERFPINDPNKTSIVSPRPNKDVDFLKGLLEGIAHIEHQGYHQLAALGAQFPSQILSCGGGAQNPTWTAIRQRILNTNVETASSSDACYGSALLAKNGIKLYL